jgi:streptogramin lyase
VGQAATDLRRVAATPREILVYLQGDGAAASGTAYVTPDARRSAGRIHLRPSPVGGDVALRGVGAVSGQAESLFLWIEGYAGGIPLPVSEEMAVSAGAWEFDLRDRDRDALTIRSDVACPEGLLELSPVADTEWVVSRASGQPVFPFLPPGRYELRLRCLGARVGSVEVDMDEGPMSLELTELGGGAFLFREITIVLDVPSAWHDAAFFAWGQFREAGGELWSDKLPVALEPIAQDRLGGRLTLPAARPVRVGLRMGEDRELATRELPPDPAGTELVFEWSSIGPAIGGGQEASVRRAPGIELAPLSSGGGLAVGEEGRVYATDPARGQVVAYEPEPLSPGWPWAGQGSLPGQLDEPAGVAVSEGGIVYVADSGNDRVQAFDGQGKFLRSFGGRGAGEGRLRAPSDVAIGPGGDLYVCDRGNDLIQVFTADGMFLRQWGESGRAPGQLSGPSSVAVASTGAVYVSDTGSHRIQTFDPMGNLLESWGGAGDGPGGLDSPTGIALDGQRNLWVADTGNQRLQVFGPSGEAKIIDLSAYGLKDPMDVALSPVDGTVWVISADGRIQGLAGPSRN